MFELRPNQNQLVMEIPTLNRKSKTQNITGQLRSLLFYDNFLADWRYYAGKNVRIVFYSMIKRAIDIILSLIGLILLSPLVLVIAAIIKLDSPGSIFFKQQRIGQNRRRKIDGDGCLHERRNENLRGKPFYIYKFRTMKANADCYAIKPGNDSDPRLTRVGKIFRAIGVDELPQLFNILKGDMSLIGPRPEMPFIVKNYGLLESMRLTIKPGLTGLWQIYGSRKEPIHKNLHYDLDYIKNRSIKLDLEIMFKTIGFMFRLQNA